MATTALTKISGVLIITQTVGFPKYYGTTSRTQAKFNPDNSGNNIYLTIGGDSYFIALTELQVSGQTPTTLTTALVLLNDILQ